MNGLRTGCQWAALQQSSDLYIDGTFASFDRLKQKYGLHMMDFFFRFLQVRNYVQTNLPEFATAHPSSRDICISD